jgi:putative sugar O-methyltransferase
MIKVKHLRHPIRALRAAKTMAAVRWRMWRIAAEGKRRFGADPRYDLDSVTAGFLPHVAEPSDDSAILHRICSAYAKAAGRSAPALDCYGASPWWEEVRRGSLGPVLAALRSRDVAVLQAMYGNFYRDPCSAGLIALPYAMSKAYFGKTIPSLHRRFYLYEILHRIKHWRAETAGQFPVAALAVPDIGNPFGAVIEGIQVEAGAPYRHYCAYRVSSLLGNGTDTVAEIGGGLGGMAYYLLRDHPRVRYCGFDLPESIALTTYYLMKAFPHLTFALYGEQRDTTAGVDVTLLPLFELPNAASQCADVTFSSHAITDVSPEALAEYLTQIARITRRHFLHVGVDAAGQSIPGAIREHHECFQLVEARNSGWHTHKTANAQEFECLYGVRNFEREPKHAIPRGHYA